MRSVGSVSALLVCAAIVAAFGCSQSQSTGPGPEKDASGKVAQIVPPPLAAPVSQTKPPLAEREPEGPTAPNLTPSPQEAKSMPPAPKPEFECPALRNLVPNGDFSTWAEDERTPTGWLYRGRALEDMFATIERCAGESPGTNAVKQTWKSMDGEDSFFRHFLSVVTLEPHTKYLLRVRAKVDTQDVPVLVNAHPLQGYNPKELASKGLASGGGVLRIPGGHHSLTDYYLEFQTEESGDVLLHVGSGRGQFPCSATWYGFSITKSLPNLLANEYFKDWGSTSYTPKAFTIDQGEKARLSTIRRIKDDSRNIVEQTWVEQDSDKPPPEKFGTDIEVAAQKDYALRVYARNNSNNMAFVEVWTVDERPQGVVQLEIAPSGIPADYCTVFRMTESKRIRIVSSCEEGDFPTTVLWYYWGLHELHP